MNRNDDFLTLFNFWTLLRPWLFPLSIAGLYVLGFVFAPESTDRGLRLSGSMFRQLVLPVCLAFVMMVVLNHYLSPATITRFLGKSAGLKGVFLSSLTGMLSMGPVYAWYPLLKTLRSKGASTFHLVNFMGSRSVKPVLLPVLVAYWGWRFSTLFVVVSFIGALLVAGITNVLSPDPYGPGDGNESP